MKTQITTLLFLAFSISTLLGQNINVTPAQINFNLEPGESTSTEIVVKNTGDSPIKISLSMGDWTMKVNGEATYHPVNTTSHSCADWITLSSNLIELNPNESKKVKLSMTVPAGNVQTRWTVIYINEAEEQVALAAVDKSLRVGTELVTRVGIPVYQSPRKSGAYKATVTNLKEIAPKDGKRQFKADIANKGDKVIKGKMFVTLSNIQTGEEIEAPIRKITILPSLKREFIFSLPPDTPKGMYALATVLDYHPDEDLEGSQIQIEVK